MKWQGGLLPEIIIYEHGEMQKGNARMYLTHEKFNEPSTFVGLIDPIRDPIPSGISFYQRSHSIRDPIVASSFWTANPIPILQEALRA